MNWRIPFGNLRINETAKKYLSRAVEKNWITEGENVQEFEAQFCKRFGWKYGIATSSGTTAGEVLWSAIREIHNKKNPGVEPTGRVISPACAFVATANVILAASLIPEFVDVSLDTLNIDPAKIPWGNVANPAGLQYVATMGKMIPVEQVSVMCRKQKLPIIGDLCEAHGATLKKKHAEYFDAAIYSFYVAHLIVGGEGGIICTNDSEIYELCRSIKSHGRPAGTINFDFQRSASNAKWNDMAAAIALGPLEDFDKTFARRREIRKQILDGLSPLDEIIVYPDGKDEVIAPHGFAIVLRDEAADAALLRAYLERAGIQTKTLFGSLPTQHDAFKFIGKKPGGYPVAERLGKTGLHFGLPEHISDADADFIIETVKNFFAGKN